MSDAYLPPPPSLRQAIFRVYHSQLAEAIARTPPEPGLLVESGPAGDGHLTFLFTPGSAGSGPAPPPPEDAPRRGRRPGRCPAGVIIALRDGPLAYAEVVRALPDSHENTVKANLKRLVSEGYIDRLPDGRYALADD